MRQFLAAESSQVLKIFRFLSGLFGHVAKWLKLYENFLQPD